MSGKGPQKHNFSTLFKSFQIVLDRSHKGAICVINFPIFTARKQSLRRLCFYRCLSVHRGNAWQGGVHGRKGCAWRGMFVAEGGMHDGGACVAGGHAWQGHAWQGVCMVGEHAWQGVCMAGGGHAWQGGGIHGRGACVAGAMHGRGCAWRGRAWQVHWFDSEVHFCTECPWNNVFRNPVSGPYISITALVACILGYKHCFTAKRTSPLRVSIQYYLKASCHAHPLPCMPLSCMPLLPQCQHRFTPTYLYIWNTVEADEEIPVWY